MISSNSAEQSNRFVDEAAASAEHAIKATQRVTNDALNSLSGSVQDIRSQAAPLLNRGSEQIGALTQRGLDAVRDTSQQLRAKALHASDATVGYIKDEPVKSMLIAAAAGAALMALIGLLARSHRHS
jgi:ElaB/YqjD/DUF883 family membrane-anchored ribosome-binding protein